MSQKISSCLKTPLPQTNLKNIPDSSIETIKSFLEEKLPESERKDIEDGLNWNLYLDKNKTSKKPKSVRKKLLKCKERKKIFGKLPKDGWKYEKLLEMNSMWKQYVLNTLNGTDKIKRCNEGDFNQFCMNLNKIELIGAEIKVVRSKNPGYIGIEGIVVMETKFTLNIVCKLTFKLKSVLKESCVFEICLDSFRFSFFGKHFLTRPGDRSVKKIKYFSLSDL
nr:uncharacterized protein LOC111428898 [Onthophagus taurus]